MNKNMSAEEIKREIDELEKKIDFKQIERLRKEVLAGKANQEELDEVMKTLKENYPKMTELKRQAAAIKGKNSFFSRHK